MGSRSRAFTADAMAVAHLPPQRAGETLSDSACTKVQSALPSLTMSQHVVCRTIEEYLADRGGLGAHWR